jgi:transglutaminase-like putative cysteine protease
MQPLMLKLTAIGCLMSSTIAKGLDSGANSAEPTGASLAWTSGEPDVVRARGLVQEGKLAQAEAQLDDSTDARREMRESIRRIRREYPLDEAALLEKLRKSIPDISPDDLRRWRDMKQIQFRNIDGQVVYFRREPSNLFRFCDESKKRRIESQSNESTRPKFVLTDHLASVIAAAQKNPDNPYVIPIKHRITYAITVKPNRPNVAAGSVVRCWLPFPKDCPQHGDVNLVSMSPADYTLAPSEVPQRTIYFEHPIDDPAKPIAFNAVYEYTSYAYYPKLDPGKAKPLPGNWGDAYLTQRPPHIVFTPELKTKVAEIIGAETNPLEKVRKIFHWIDANIPWAAEEEYAIIPNLSMHGYTNRRGDCGVQSMLFITMCRIAGVPARWQSGWETKPLNWNMHDWAEVYVEPWGWLPCDVSYGLQKSDDPKIREFYIGHQDSYRMIVNTDYGHELVPPKKSPRSEPADFQRGEVEIDGRNLYFDEWDYEFKLEQAAVDR